VAVVRASSYDSAVLFTFCFVDDVMLAHDDQTQATPIGRMLKVTGAGQHRGAKSAVMSTTACLD